MQDDAAGELGRWGRGKQPKLPPSAQRTIRRRYAEEGVSLVGLVEEYSVGRSTIHRIVHTPAPG